MLKNVRTALGLLMVAALPFGCATDNPDAPHIGGYSTGLVITKLSAIPDVVAQGSDTYVTLRLETRNRDYAPLPGRNVAFFLLGFTIPDSSWTLCTGTLGTITTGTDVTDANGIALGVFESGDINGWSTDPLCLSPLPVAFRLYNTLIRGKITDPREGESEAQIQDDIEIEHYLP